MENTTPSTASTGFFQENSYWKFLEVLHIKLAKITVGKFMAKFKFTIVSYEEIKQLSSWQSTRRIA